MLPDGELYTGTVADYRGNRPVISRHLSESRRVDLKLDDTLGWLEGKSPFFQRHILNTALYIKSMLLTRSPNFDNKVSFIFYFQLLFFLIIKVGHLCFFCFTIVWSRPKWPPQVGRFWPSGRMFDIPGLNFKICSTINYCSTFRSFSFSFQTLNDCCFHEQTVTVFCAALKKEVVTSSSSTNFAADPTFISSSYIPDEEKIYFFFSEVGREYDFIDKFIVSRVSQICMVRMNLM